MAKEMIQNINMLRFQNAIFESIWNRTHINNVQITVLEKEGVGTRGGYYDDTGALRDMVQNHLLQLLAITAMEPPKTLDADDVRNEKVKVFKALREFSKDDLSEKLILGQYNGYQKEDKVDDASSTETLVATKVFIDNKRWEGVPF
ncbi:MAG TPA: glucose-6-phosphate dehydrogenase, partial [Clostridiaceae bacterium]|nr:glucose-6-phosphate dehydrogenase [Clostridiaceae bacterium]